MGINIEGLNIANEAIEEFLQAIPKDDGKLRSDLNQVKSSLNSLKNASMFSIMIHAGTLESSLEEVFKRIGDADCNIDAHSRLSFSIQIESVLLSNNLNGMPSFFESKIAVLKERIEAAQKNAIDKINDLETKDDGIVPNDPRESVSSSSSSVGVGEDAPRLAANEDSMEEWGNLELTAEQNIAERTQAIVQSARQMLESVKELDHLSTENYTNLLKAERELQSCWDKVDEHVKEYENKWHVWPTNERQVQRALGEQAKEIKNENPSLLEDLGKARTGWLKKWSDELQSEKNQLIALLKKTVHDLSSEEVASIQRLYQRVMHEVDQAKALSKDSPKEYDHSLYTEGFLSVAGWNTEVQEAKKCWLSGMSVSVASLCNNENDTSLNTSSVAEKLVAVMAMKTKINVMPEALREEKWVTDLQSREESLKNIQADLQAQEKHKNQQCQAIDPRSKATDKATPAAQPKAVSRLRYWWQRNRLFLALWLVVTGSAVIGALLSATAVAPALASVGIASVTVLGVSFPPILLGVAALALGVFAISQIAYFKGKPWGTALELKLGWQVANAGQKANFEKSSSSLDVPAENTDAQQAQRPSGDAANIKSELSGQTSTAKDTTEPSDQSSGLNP